MSERDKYVGIYGPAGFKQYGHSCHGAKALPIIRERKIASLVDVGCGHNEFAMLARKWCPGARIVGVDFACPSADVKADATALPFADKSFDVLTAFDVLEHLLPEQVSPALAGFARVSRSFIFSIAHAPSVYKWQGATLHPTVQPEAWWIERIEEAGGIGVHKEGRFIVGEWRDNLPVPDGASCILVGNGPSVLRARRGFAIDSFDEVVRFNTFKTAGFEEHTGAKTTLWSTFGRGTLPQDDVKPSRVLFTRGEQGTVPYEPSQMWRIPLTQFNDLRDRVRAASTLADEAKAKLIPSSGLQVALWLLENGAQKITLAGFDHFSKDQSSQHHYWLKRPFIKPKEHDGDAEAALLKPFVEAGRVTYLV